MWMTRTICLVNTQTMTFKTMTMKRRLTQMVSLCHPRNKSGTSSMRFLHTDSKSNKSKMQKRKISYLLLMKSKVQKAAKAFQIGNVLILSAKKTISSALFAWTVWRQVIKWRHYNALTYSIRAVSIVGWKKSYSAQTARNASSCEQTHRSHAWQRYTLKSLEVQQATFQVLEGSINECILTINLTTV